MNKVGLLLMDVIIVYSYRAVESEERPLLELKLYLTLEDSLSFRREVGGVDLGGYGLGWASGLKQLHLLLPSCLLGDWICLSIFFVSRHISTWMSLPSTHYCIRVRRISKPVCIFFKWWALYFSLSDYSMFC